MGTIKKRITTLIFIGITALLFFLFGYNKIFFKGPFSIHKWRQADCLSITSNYYTENQNFFTPAVHMIGNAGNGKTISEFPAVYYLVAQLWKIFGQHEFIFRIVNLLIILTGLVYLFKAFKLIIEDVFWSFAGVLLLTSSLIFVYYSNNFLMDAPALAIAFVALYNYLRFHKSGKTKYLYFSCLLFALAGLLKLSSLISFTAILILHSILVFHPRHEVRFKLNTLIPFTIPVIFTIGWFFYVKYYNRHNNSGIFLQGFLPLWDVDAKDVPGIFRMFKRNILPAFFDKTALFALVVLLFLSFVKKGALYLKILSSLVLVGVILFFILFYEVFNVHDYYLINCLVIIPIFFIAILSTLKQAYPSVFNGKILKIIFSLALLYLTYQTAINNRIRYTTDDFLVQHSFLVDEGKMKKWKDYRQNYADHFESLETIKPYLEELGIHHNDTVISIPDGSINISLYLMDKKGFTDFGNASKGEERIRSLIQQGARYLIVNDTTILANDSLKTFTTHKMGTYKKVNIYDLSEFKR